jgi:hypothetical protein
MKIEGIENILTMFSVFHDGGISQCTKDNSTLQFNVEIQYLTERIDPSFKAFHIALYGVSDLSFTTWPDDAEAKPDTFTDIRTIFTPELEILSGEVENNLIKVACNQPLPNLGYCGGFLKLSATSAVVKDEAEKEYSIEELCSLSDGYWDEWANKNKAK